MAGLGGIGWVHGWAGRPSGRGVDWPRAWRSADLWPHCCLALLLASLSKVLQAAVPGAWLKVNGLFCVCPMLPGSCCGRTRRRP